jgi:alkane 1-monooxygenase
MWHTYKYLLAFALPIGALVDLITGRGHGWIVPAIAFGLLPLLEHFFTDHKENQHTAPPWWFDVLLYMNAPLLFAIVTLWFYRWMHADYTWLEICGYTLTTGIIAGVTGINVAHELGHRIRWWEKALGFIMLVPSLYSHWQEVHNRGHHKNVGTPLDPTTARKGEWIYAFWLRSMSGTWTEAFRLYQMDRKRNNGTPPFMIAIVAMSLYLAILILFGGIPLLLMGIVVAFISASLLESVNYIEHYGLFRKQKSTGSYERVLPVHSWNSDHVLGRIFLYELTRHSDHHYRAATPYQDLQSMPQSPQLPTGYPGSILMALVPPLWFRIMDQRIPLD